MNQVKATKKCIIIIPAYEPDFKLVSLLQEIKLATDYDVVLVNDGSSSESALAIMEQAQEYAHMLSHTSNLGKGVAIKTALAYIRDNIEEDCVIVTMDADGQHKVSDAIRVCEKAMQKRASLVIGSRRFSGKVPIRSRFGNSVTRFVYRLATGIKVRDTQTGLRAFGNELLEFMLGIAGNRYEYEMNVLLECTREEIPVYEVPIDTVYINDNQSSHFDTVKDSYRIYKEIIRFCASSLIGFAVDFCAYSLMLIITRDLSTAMSLTISNIVARMISASVNYYINKKYVFKSKDSYVKTALKYFSLAAGILIANTLLLNMLVKFVLGNKVISKLLVEVGLFIISWLVQRFVVFKKQSDKEAHNETTP